LMDEQQPPAPESPPAQESPPATVPEVPPESAFDMLFERGRVTFIAIVLLVEVALFMLAIVVPVDANLRQQLVAQGQSALPSTNTSAGALVGLIVANNLRVALLEMVPAFGFILLPISILASGIIVQGFAISNAVSPAVVAFSYLLLPFTFVELLAYAIALVSGTMVLVAWRRRRLHREAKVFALEIAAIVVVLTVAAAMETISIFSPLLGILLWLPLAVAAVPVILRIVKQRP